jgi:hypothetical protein
MATATWALVFGNNRRRRDKDNDNDNDNGNGNGNGNGNDDDDDDNDARESVARTHSRTLARSHARTHDVICCARCWLVLLLVERAEEGNVLLEALHPRYLHPFRDGETQDTGHAEDQVPLRGEEFLLLPLGRVLCLLRVVGFGLCCVCVCACVGFVGVEKESNYYDSYDY